MVSSHNALQEMAEAMEAERLRQEELDTLHKEQADGDECNRIYEVSDVIFAVNCDVCY